MGVDEAELGETHIQPMATANGEAEHIGIIYGDVGTSSFKCILNSVVNKTEFIQAHHPKVGWVLGRVDSVQRQTDLTIEKARQLSSGKETYFNERITAEVDIIGYRDDRDLLQVPHTPFRAGEKIYFADEEFIREIVGLPEASSSGAYVGLLMGHDIKAYFDINIMVQKHVSVLAKTGGGKSYLTGVIIEELIKHGVTVVILDPHGEYSTLKETGKAVKSNRNFDTTPRNYKGHIMEFSPDTSVNRGAKPLKFTLNNMDARALMNLTNTKSAKSYMLPLRHAINVLKDAKPSYSLSDIIRVVETIDDPSVPGLLKELEYLDEMDIFAEKGTHLHDLVMPGKTTIINLRGTPPDIQELIVNRLSTALFDNRKLDRIPPMMLVVEEAHNFCPQVGTAACSKILRTIASEGRKFGLGLMIISQRAAKVDKNVLSQCNTQIILKITNPNDLKAIVSSIEGLTPGMMEEIQALPIGVSIVTGGGLSMPLLIEIRPRETRHGGESVAVIK